MKQKAPTRARKGRPAFRPTDEQRATVSRLKLLGATDEKIAAILEIALGTLKKHFGREVEHARTELLGNVAAGLYQQALSGNVTASIFILKTRAGWCETDRHELTGPDGAPLMPEIELPPLMLVEYVDAAPNPDDPPRPE